MDHLTWPANISICTSLFLFFVAEAWAKKFKSLSDNPKWTGRPPASAQDDHVSTNVLRFLHSHGVSGVWGRVDDMWQAKFMP